MQRRVEMRSVKVKRTELLQKIKINKEKHVKEYQETVANYILEAMKQIDEQIEKLVSRKAEIDAEETLELPHVSFRLPMPQNHEKDYEQVIQMLQMSVDEELEIKADEFACYVMDDWDWKQDFLAVSANYKK